MKILATEKLVLHVKKFFAEIRSDELGSSLTIFSSLKPYFFSGEDKLIKSYVASIIYYFCDTKFPKQIKYACE